MGFTLFQIFLAGLMLITGTINTLSTKWADRYDRLIPLSIRVFAGLADSRLAFVIDPVIQSTLSIHSFK